MAAVLPATLSGPRSAILDIGSRTVRAGLTGELAPSVVTASIVGRIQNKALALSALSPEQQAKNLFFGADCESKMKIPGLLSVVHPFSKGIYNAWDEAETLWKYLLSDALRVDCATTPIVLTEAMHTPREHRERITQIFFESLQVSQFALVSSAASVMAQTGHADGVVIDLGETTSSVSVVAEGYALPNCSKVLNFGGNDLTDLLVQLLLDKGTTIENPAERDIVEKAKETVCYVAPVYEDEAKRAQFATDLTRPLATRLPDQLKRLECVTIGKERFEIPEALFRPNLLGKDTVGLAQATVDAILKCNIDSRPTLCERIVLCGGGAKFPGLSERLARDIDASLARGGGGGKIKLPPVRIVSPSCLYPSWNGAAVLSSLPDFIFSRNMMTKDLYEEYGPTLVHKMCFQ